MSEDTKKRDAAEASALLGAPWRPLGRGPDSFDCWGLARHMFACCRGIELPEHLVHPSHTQAVSARMETESGSSDWIRLPGAEHFAVVGMGKGNGGGFSHVGLWLDIDGGLCLHCSEDRGVRADGARVLKALGYDRLAFYKPAQAQ